MPPNKHRCLHPRCGRERPPVSARAARHLRRAARIATDPDVECSWAIEVALDPGALIDDGRSRNGLIIRVTGYSPSVRCSIAVTLLSDGHPANGTWHVATVWITTRSKEDAP